MKDGEVREYSQNFLPANVRFGPNHRIYTFEYILYTVYTISFAFISVTADFMQYVAPFCAIVYNYVIILA